MKTWWISIVGLVFPISLFAQPENNLAKNNTTGSVSYEVSKSGYLVKDSVVTTPVGKKNKSTLTDRFSLFDQIADHSVYSIILAADVPNDKKPMKVYHKNEPGHVFVILEKKDTISGLVVSQSWGFYPDRPVSCLLFNKVKCKLVDNGGRVYNAGLRQQLTKKQFDGVRTNAITLAAKKYSLNKYNCYDYAVELYNSIDNIEDLPLEKVKFPFIFGRGGSPCGLYKQLMALTNRMILPDNIHMGVFKAPLSGLRSLNIYATNNPGQTGQR